MISVPFYFLNLLNLTTPLGQPPSVLMIFVPLAVALGMRYREQGIGGIKDLVRPFATGQGRWLFFSLLVIPTLVAAMYAISLLMGLTDTGGTMLPVSSVLFSLGLYFLGAIPEEVGWTMYASEPFTERYGPLLAGFIIGLVWGLWHVVPYLSAGRDWGWIAAQVGISVVLRMIMVQVFVRTRGSLLPALIIHASVNLYPDMLPGGLDSYHPAVLAPLLLIALVAMRPLVTARWS